MLFLLGRAFRGNVSSLPLLVYWRLNNDSILRQVQNKIPRWVITVRVVVGDKSMSWVSTASSGMEELTPSDQHVLQVKSA